MKLISTLAVILLPALAQAETVSITQTLVNTLNSEVDVSVSGDITSGPLVPPAFTGTVTTAITYDDVTGEITNFEFTGGSFLLANASYNFTLDKVPFPALPGVATTTGLGFDVLPSSFTAVQTSPGSTEYNLSGNLNLGVNAGEVSAIVSGITETVNYADTPATISPNLSVTSNMTFSGGNVALANIRFGETEIFSQTVNVSGQDFTANVSIASVNTIELTAVPEPASFALLLGGFTLGLALNRRRARQ